MASLLAPSKWQRRRSIVVASPSLRHGPRNGCGARRGAPLSGPAPAAPPGGAALAVGPPPGCQRRGKTRQASHTSRLVNISPSQACIIGGRPAEKPDFTWGTHARVRANARAVLVRRRMQLAPIQPAHSVDPGSRLLGAWALHISRIRPYSARFRRVSQRGAG